MERNVPTPTEIRMGLSMQSLVDSSTLYSMFMPIEWHNKVAVDAHYDGGLEAWPFRVVPEMQIKSGLISQSALNSIESGHISYRSEVSFPRLREIVKDPQARFSTQVIIALPHLEDSIPLMNKLQNMVGRDIAIVTYHEEGLDNPYFGKINNKLFQPFPELLERWNVEDAKSLFDKSKTLGFDGFCLDTLHMGTLRKNIEEYLEYTKEIHLRVGSNTESTEITTRIDTKKELEDLYFNRKNTDIFPLIDRVRNSGWKGRVVTEIPARSIKEMLGINSIFLTKNKLVNAHRIIVENIRSRL